MAPDLVGLLRRLADEYEAEEQGEASAAQETARDERIAVLEARIEQASSPSVNAALGELSDEEASLILQHRAGALEAAAEEEPEPEPEPVPKRTRPGRKSGQAYSWTVGEDGERMDVDIPIVYSGPDEPDEVELAEQADAA